MVSVWYFAFGWFPVDFMLLTDNLSFLTWRAPIFSECAGVPNIAGC